MVLRDGTLGVEVVGVWLGAVCHRIVGRVGREWGGVLIWCGDDSGHSLIADVAFKLIVDVGVTVREGRVSGTGSRGESGVVSAVIIRGRIL